jgi:serine/threonine protein kinase
MKEIFKGLKYLHSKNICHRDLTFNNIIYDPELKSVKIIDFNVSKYVTAKLLTNTGTL